MPKKFWEDGIRFECQGTGRCCVSHTSYGYVYLTLEDRRRLARALGIPTAKFTRLNCSKTGGHFHLKEVEGPCRFLEGKGCTVYDARPAQCRTWPFWPENMKPKVWAREVASFCPGIGKGRIHSREEILALMRQDPIGGEA